MRVLGIDPGIDGALVLMDGELPVKWAVMPTVKAQAGFRKRNGRLIYDENGNKIPKYRTEVDPVEMVRIFRDFAPDHIFLEEVTSRPAQGVVSVFSFGRSFGDVRTAGAWLGCDLTRVRPQEWQKAIFKGLDRKDSKIMAVETVCNLWPGINLRKSKRARKLHGGLCDAACIAEYGRRQLAEGSDGQNAENHN